MSRKINVVHIIWQRLLQGELRNTASRKSLSIYHKWIYMWCTEQIESESLLTVDFEDIVENFVNEKAKHISIHFNSYSY